MKIAVKLAFDEQAALRLLNWLAQENARLLRARPELPLLYDMFWNPTIHPERLVIDWRWCSVFMYALRATS